MKHILISDMTLRQAPAGALSFKNRLELIRELDRAGADYIEMAPITDEKADSLLIRTAASMVTGAGIVCPVGLTVDTIAPAWQAISRAEKARLQVTIPMSAVQMEYICGKKPAKVLDLIRDLVSSCAALCPDVEFCAGDATRAERAFLQSALETAVDAGAVAVTLCDSAGTMLPDEFRTFLLDLQAEIPALREIPVGVECSNDLGMAAACAFEALFGGAAFFKTSAIGSFPALEAMGQIFRTRGDSLGLSCSLDMTGLRRAVGRIAQYIEARRDSTPFDSVGSGESVELTLGADSDIAAVSLAAKRLGYDLSTGDLSSVYAAFQRIASQKKIDARDLDTIIASVALQVPPTYKLESYVINAGSRINATAHVRLEKDGEVLVGLATGDGPIDAAFLAVGQIMGHHYELDDFQIQAVTEGREAMGSTLVRLRDRGRLFSGQGVSTDIIGASIHAYLNALNKIVYEGAW